MRAMFRRAALLLACSAVPVACSPSPPIRSAAAPATASTTTAAVSPAGAPANGGDAARVALSLGDRVLADAFERSPLLPTMLHAPGVSFDTLPDRSIAATRDREAKDDATLAELQRLDPRALEANKPAELSYDVALETVEREVNLRPCKNELWSISPSSNGWLQEFAAFVEVQPVGTDALRTQALARFGKMPAYIDGQIVNLKEGARQGYVAYDGTVRAVLGQLDKLLAAPAGSSPLMLLAERDGAPEFRTRLAAVVDGGIVPAVRRYRDFLEHEYLPHARKTPGLASQKDGDRCYRGSLRAITTLDLDPKQVHQTGWDELAKIEAEMKVISAKSFGGADPKVLLERFRSDPTYHYRSREEMIALAQATIERARVAMPRAFGLLPPDTVTVEPIPAFLEKGSAHHYQAAALDGSRPATYRIRLYQPEQQSKVLGESTAFHETIPGHHLQVDIATHRPDVPPIARFVFNSGYVEGWGLYAEQLADELGLYSSDADRLGMLSNRAWRAVRLIVDSGIHSLGWDRQKAIDTMLAHTATSPDFVASEVDRYIAWPGQACAYMIGYLEITRLRDEAKQKLGARFDQRRFHDRVLENGSIPLPVLRRKIEAWIASEVQEGKARPN
jgi:uncharacterized protein (DUF885 family)